MEVAFWDTSALVPLCIRQEGTELLQQLVSRYDMVVWWGTPVEARSAFARELRAGVLTSVEHEQAKQRLEELRTTWREIQPREALRRLAESMLDRYQLRAADALQLAAAYTWSLNRPFDRHLISGDKRLLEAAHDAGFRVIQSS